MKKITVVLLLLSMINFLALTACGVLREPEAASGPIEAIPLETQSAGVIAEPTSVATEPALAVATADDPAETAATPEATAETTAPTDEPATEAPPDVAVVFTLDPAASQVRFQLDEDLRGVRTTVVGVTNQVAGQLSINLADLNQTQVGVIQINARTLMTNNNFRNRAIQNDILNTGAYEFISFTPTSIEGLPATATVGQMVSFTINGDLTIRDITQPATFTVEATAISETQITGTAAAVVNRTGFGLQIPSVPSVANVEEEIELYIDFTANAS